jgi:hypothetical protein
VGVIHIEVIIKEISTKKLRKNLKHIKEVRSKGKVA